MISSLFPVRPDCLDRRAARTLEWRLYNETSSLSCSCALASSILRRLALGGWRYSRLAGKPVLHYCTAMVFVRATYETHVAANWLSISNSSGYGESAGAFAEIEAWRPFSAGNPKCGTWALEPFSVGARAFGVHAMMPAATSLWCSHQSDGLRGPSRVIRSGQYCWIRCSFPWPDFSCVTSLSLIVVRRNRWRMGLRARRHTGVGSGNALVHCTIGGIFRGWSRQPSRRILIMRQGHQAVVLNSSARRVPEAEVFERRCPGALACAFKRIQNADSYSCMARSPTLCGNSLASEQPDQSTDPVAPR